MWGRETSEPHILALYPTSDSHALGEVPKRDLWVISAPFLHPERCQMEQSGPEDLSQNIDCSLLTFVK